MNKLLFGPLWGMRAVWLLVYIDGLAESLHLLKQLTEGFLAVSLRFAAVEPFCGLHTY